MEPLRICDEPAAPLKPLEDVLKTKVALLDGQMTSSTTSSLTSPVDSGVQLLDSESEITSLMSVSGLGCDFDAVTQTDFEESCKNGESVKAFHCKTDKQIIEAISKEKQTDTISHVVKESDSYLKNCHKEDKVTQSLLINKELKPKSHLMTKSDIDNHNMSLFDLNSSPAILPVTMPTNSMSSIISAVNAHADNKMNAKRDKQMYRMSDPIKNQLSDDLFELEPILIGDNTVETKKSDTSDDLMNVSLNSYELLDYTLQNSKLINDDVTATDDMHVSMSEEVNETLKVNVIEVNPPTTEPEPEKPVNTPADDQIVFRRQRRKKSKSDTPKKRVSFHEDILNSTKVDDVHINHGFITHESDLSASFFERGFTRRPGVVKGRYSWAAEGDAPYYQRPNTEREVKSDIYIHRARFSSTSSSSSTSISSSIDEEDTGNSNSDDAFVKKEPTQSLPKSSCLKKTKTNKKYIDTNIVEEETNLRKKKSETNLLDSNIFGSLKNIFSFSTSVPLAERGVPEGQEDITIYSTSDPSLQKQRRYSNGEFSVLNNCDGYEVQPAPVKKIGNLNLELAKTNLKLTKSEGFYPNYPCNQVLPNNVLLCDSNVYEHKGISYSYEYEKFQKTFEQQNRPKSSTIYQMLLNELNFFKKKEKNALEKDSKENFEVLAASTPMKDSDDSQEDRSIKKYTSSVKIDFSDSETSWDFSESSHTRHLHSPKRKVNRANHYTVQSLRGDSFDEKSDSECQLTSAKSLPSIKSSSSKTSLINRFLKNVTMKKMMDLKLQKKQQMHRRYLSLYVKGVKPNNDLNRQVDIEIEKEIVEARGKKKHSAFECDTHLLYKFKNEIFRNFTEALVGVFPVYSAYTTSGENRPLMIVLSNTTFYITGFKPNNSYCNHFVLPYTELNTILIGPNAQTLHISNYDKDMQCIITTGSENVTNELIVQMEMAMRRDVNKPKLLAVKQLNMRDMVNLRKTICKQTSIAKDEEYFHYSVVNIQDYNSDACETPLGPSKEGPLMFKTSENETRWETAYFILKAGILYMLSSPSHRLPMRVLPLINGACQGARRVYSCTRPHTFQIQVGTVTLHLAAPDEYVASEWLQALVHAASKTYSHREKLPAQSCSLLMTSDHILTVREAFPCTLSSSLALREQHQPIKGPQALSCAAIADITAFRLPCAEQSWCILEFACREVHESSGDWILYFATNTELEKFISTLEMLWAYHNEQGDCFPLSTIPETEPLSRKCIDTYNMIQNTWLSLQMNLKSF